MLELILVIGIVTISILLGQIIRWCRNSYFMTCIQNDNIRILLSGLRLIFEDIPEKDKLIRYNEIIRSLEIEGELFQKEVK